CVADRDCNHGTEHTMKVSKRLAGASVIVAMVTAALMLPDGARARDLRTSGPRMGPSIPLLQATASLAKSSSNNPVHRLAPNKTSNLRDPCFPANCSSLRHLENLIAYISIPGNTVLSRRLLETCSGTCQATFSFPDGFGNTKSVNVHYTRRGLVPGDEDRV